MHHYVCFCASVILSLTVSATDHGEGLPYPPSIAMYPSITRILGKTTLILPLPLLVNLQ